MFSNRSMNSQLVFYLHSWSLKVHSLHYLVSLYFVANFRNSMTLPCRLSPKLNSSGIWPEPYVWLSSSHRNNKETSECSLLRVGIHNVACTGYYHCLLSTEFFSLQQAYNTLRCIIVNPRHQQSAFFRPLTGTIEQQKASFTSVL